MHNVKLDEQHMVRARVVVSRPQHHCLGYTMSPADDKGEVILTLFSQERVGNIPPDGWKVFDVLRFDRSQRATVLEQLHETAMGYAGGILTKLN